MWIPEHLSVLLRIPAIVCSVISIFFLALNLYCQYQHSFYCLFPLQAYERWNISLYGVAKKLGYAAIILSLLCVSWVMIWRYGVSFLLDWSLDVCTELAPFVITTIIFIKK